MSHHAMTDKPVLIARSRNRMPDHLVYATLVDETKQVIARRVLTEIYKPNSHRGKIDIVFHPRPEHIAALQYVPAVSVYGRSRDAHLVIRGEEIWHDLATTGTQDGIQFMYPCKGNASNLEIRHSLGPSKSNFVKAGTFWLTECRLINTGMILKHDYRGSVRAKQVARLTFTLRTGVRLAFRKHFGTDRDTGDKLAQLVAEFSPKTQLTAKSLQKVLDDLDDVLVLASFASRRRCFCTGWWYSDENGNFTEFYRRSFVLPPESQHDDGLISIRLFMKFLRTSYRQFVRTSHQKLIRNAIYALTSEGGTLDNQFLRFFAGLESALLHVQRVNRRVGRLSLVEKFEGFQKIYNVDLSDLWPLLDSSSGKSLAQIRNRSVHGEYLNESC
jgi:hypothetical protein